MARLATASQENLDRLMLVEHLTEPSVSTKEEEVLPVLASPCWMYPIREYLQNGTLPADSNEAAKMRMRLARFSMVICINEVF